jgi:phosphatidate cytidylyltransferase
LLQGPKLLPRISPNKTWTGSIGGLAGGTIAGLLVSRYLLQDGTLTVLFMSACLSLATQLGDLMESALKRRFQVKDSGWFIPGHGGILDRIDGLLFAAPVFALFHFWLGY